MCVYSYIYFLCKLIDSSTVYWPLTVETLGLHSSCSFSFGLVMNTRTKIHQCSARAIFTAVPHGQQQAASHLYQRQQKDVEIKSALVITIKVKKIIGPKIPGNIKPAIPAAFRMHAWLGESRALGAEEKHARERL